MSAGGIMTKTDNAHADINRRDFLAASIGLTLALTLTPQRVNLDGEAHADAPVPLNIWLTISTDGTINIVSPAAEMGQGTFTTLPAVLADELDADWSKVRPVYPSEWDENIARVIRITPRWNR